jgi:hypothetical protein
MRAAPYAMAALVALSSPTEGVAVADGAKVPVVVELFSSEGCSSCPPADALLARLDHDQPIAGVDVIALEMHVDYWNQLGWVDPFSQAAFTSRQRAHDYFLHTGRIYTPQMVVDGRDELTGSNAAGATLAIQQAARAPHVSVKVTRSTPDALLVEIGTAPSAEGTCHAMLATTERNLRTTVTAGENAGQMLAHGPIVRSLRFLGDLGPTGLRLQVPQPVKSGTRVVVFVEGRDNLHVLGAGAVD